MRLAVVAIFVLAGAVIGCGSGTGPATPPFAPFGNDPSNTSAEPAGGSVETPPNSRGVQTIAQLCVTSCTRVATVCPSAASTDCASGCEAAPSLYPNCMAQLQAFLSCYATATLTCQGTSVDAPTCSDAAQTFLSCSSPPGS